MTPEEQITEKRIKDAFEIIRGLNLSESEVIKLLKKNFEANTDEINIPFEINIPLNIFKTCELSSLEVIVKYLRENHRLTFRKIGELTGRSKVSLCVTYRNSLKKHKETFVEISSAYNIPVSILKNRKKSVLENLVFYLKQNFNLTYHNIAILLNRNDRTIWTVYQRALKKNG